VATKTKAKRKLVAKSLLLTLYERKQLGVPLSRLIADFNLDIARGSLTPLLNHYHSALKKETSMPELAEGIFASLFPPWLTDNNEVQQNPDSWSYQGYFPLGKWVRNDKNN